MADPDVLLLHLGHHGGNSLFVLWVSHHLFSYTSLPSFLCHFLCCFTLPVIFHSLTVVFAVRFEDRVSLLACHFLPILLFPILAPGCVVAPLQHICPQKPLSGFDFLPSNFVWMVIQDLVRFVVKLTMYI